MTVQYYPPLPDMRDAPGMNRGFWLAPEGPSDLPEKVEALLLGYLADHARTVNALRFPNEPGYVVQSVEIKAVRAHSAESRPALGATDEHEGWHIDANGVPIVALRTLGNQPPGPLIRGELPPEIRLGSAWSLGKKMAVIAALDEGEAFSVGVSETVYFTGERRMTNLEIEFDGSPESHYRKWSERDPSLELALPTVHAVPKVPENAAKPRVHLTIDFAVRR